MKILAVDTTATAASCCVTDDDKVLGRFSVNAGLTHSRTLLPMIEQTLADCGVTPAEIDRLAVAAGPGSFTGVRIGVAAVKGLALPGDKPCVGVSTLAAMARMWEGVPMTATVCAVMDARCQQVYTALFAVADGAVSRLTPDEAISIDELKEKLQAVRGSVLLVGDGAGLCAKAFADMENVRLAPPALRMQDAVGVAREAMYAQPVPARELLPVYLRVPQAERELRARQAAQKEEQK